MKNSAMFLFLVYWILCLSDVRASNFSLIMGYEVLLNNKTELKISQAECKPMTGNYVDMEISNDAVIIRDNANKSLIFSVGSNIDYQVLEAFKKDCLDNLANANCLDEFIEKFYTLFDPFQLEYKFYSGDNLMLAKLVKENSSDLKSYVQTGIMYLYNSPEKLIGPVMVYDISSGRKVFSTNIKNNESSLDLSWLKRGNYLLVCGNKQIKFILNN